MDYNNITLYSYSSKGKVKVWKAYTDFSLNNSGHIILTLEWGYENGKMQTKIRTVKAGKNKGKSNETTIQQQAQLELNSLYQSQLDDGYVTDISLYQVPRRPQLAHKYSDKKHKINWDQHQYASLKLDGLRCFIFIKPGRIVSEFQSRTGKPFKMFTHIADSIQSNYEGLPLDPTKEYILDGELFNKDIPFEVLCSLINSDEYVEIEHEGVFYSTQDVQFHMYDFIFLENLELSFEERFVQSNFQEFGSLKIVNSTLVQSEEELVLFANKAVESGYEGAMLRSSTGTYQFGERTVDLLKYKTMFDEEFLIIDIIDSENEPGQPKFIVQVKPNVTCEVCLKGSKENNKQFLINAHLYKNKAYLTVQFQEYSSYGNLKFPVGLGIREGEIINGTFTPTY